MPQGFAFALVMLVGGIGIGWVYRDLWAVYQRWRQCKAHGPHRLCDRCGTVTEGS